MSQRELRGRHGWLPAAALPALCALLIAAVWLLGVGRQPTTVRRMNNVESYSGLEFRGMKKSFYTENGDSYGVLTSGPNYDLPAGTYRMNWVIETDAENTIRIASKNGARIEPSELVIPANTWNMSAEFEILEDAIDVEFLIDFEAGTYLRVQDIEMVSPEYTDNAWTLTFLILFLGLMAGLSRRGYMTPERWSVTLILGMAAMVSIIPSLKASLSIGHDTLFHLTRVNNLVQGLREGSFPVRVAGFTYMGYGAATSVFYPELFCYIPALMILSGASLAYSMNVLLIGISLLTAFLMYLAARRVLGGVWQGVVASVLYTLAPYRIMDMYSRFALGEALAMTMIPLFFWGLYEVLCGDRRRWRLLVLGATGVFQSHILSTALCGLCAVAAGIALLPRVIREKRMGAVLKAIAATLLVNLFFLVPFATLSRQGVGASMLISANSLRTICLAQMLVQGTGNLPSVPRDPTIEGFPLEIGIPLAVGAMLALCAALGRPKGDALRRRALLLCAAAACFAFMATPFFPWDRLSVLTHSMSDYLQFPWRLITLAVFALALAGGIGVCELAGAHGRQAAVAVLVAAIYIVMPHLTTITVSDNVVAQYETRTSAILHGDYTLPGTDLNRMTEQEPLVQGEMRLEQYRKDGTHVSAQVDAQEDAVLTLPLFGFDGYRAEVDGERMEVGLGDNSRLTVFLPAGTGGTLRVWYEGKGYWRISDAISLATALALAADWLRKREKKKPGCAK